MSDDESLYIGPCNELATCPGAPRLSPEGEIVWRLRILHAGLLYLTVRLSGGVLF